MENNNQFQNNNTNPDFNIPTDEATKNPIKKAKRWARKNPKKFNIIMASITGAAVVAAILAPTLVSITRKGGGVTPQPTPPTPTKTHVVTFDTDGGTTVKSQNVADGEYAVQPVSPSKTGFAFDGWYADAGKSTPFNFDTTTITSDIKIYAKWKTEVVTTILITYDANGHGKFDDQSTSVKIPSEKGKTFRQLITPRITADTNWSHTGWTDSAGQEIQLDTPINADTTFKAKYDANPKKNTITFTNLAGESTNSWKVTVKGLTTYNLLADDYSTYGDFELPVAECGAVDGKVPTFAHWSKDRQTSTEGTLPTAIKSTDPIKDGDKLYPCFNFEEPTQIITLNVRLLNDQFHKQSLTRGSLTIEVPYKQNSTNNKIFQEVNKPDIYEYNKVFYKYYQSYDESTGTFLREWDPKKIIDDTCQGANIYVAMETPYTDPIVKFTIDPKWAAAGHTITWVGNQEVRINSGDKLYSIATPNAYCDATAHPNPSIGFITDWYFTGWYKSDDTSKTILDSTTKFDTSCTLYPKFEEKTNVVIQTYKTGGGTPTDPLKARYLPTDSWGDVKKPDEIKYMGTTDIFVDWQAQLTSGETVSLNDLDKVEQIKSTDHETVTIVPNILNEGACHEFNFLTSAHVKGTELETVTVKLAGNKKVGIPTSATDDININLKLNKPILPKADDSTSPATVVNEDVTFENEWEISTDQTNWTALDEYPPITAGTSRTVYYVRPVIIKNTKIQFSAGDGTLKPWEGSKVITEIQVSPEEIFANMYKPEVDPPANKAFKCWVDESGNEIELTHRFSVEGSPHKLTAKYVDSWVTSTVNFKIDEEALNDPHFPAEPFNDDNCEPTLVKHEPDDVVKFGQFVQHIPTRPCYEVTGWYYIGEGGTHVTCDENTVIPSSTRTLDVYPIWNKVDVKYHEITIKSDPTNYSNDGDSRLYVKEDATFINTETNQLYAKTDDGKKITFESKVWAVGKKIDHWEDSEGNKLSPTMGKNNLTNVVPKFVDADPIYVKFKTSPLEWSLSSSADKPVLINDKLSKYIADPTWIPTATKTKGTFSNWAIYNGDDEAPTPITDDYRVTGQITLIPQFIDESIFEGSSDPYYYDEDAKKWASIKTFYEPEYHNDELGVHYQDGTDGWVSKSTFNYEIKFGSQMTKLPDYFMFGCSNWNNAGQPLNLPTSLSTGGKISGLTSIGHDVMHGCSSFNQPINILASTSETGVAFTIGQNFMRGCSSFNKNISIKWNVEGAGKAEASLAIADGFMFECNNFASVLDLTGWTQFGYLNWSGKSVFENLTEEYFYSCLSTTDQDYKQFKVYVNSNLENTFKNLFPSMNGAETGHLYRWTNRNIVVEGK